MEGVSVEMPSTGGSTPPFSHQPPSFPITTHTSGAAESVRSEDSSPVLCINKKGFSKDVFYAQAVLIYIICIACIINLSIGSEHSGVWVSLLSASLGYLLPAPKVRHDKRNTVVGLARDVTSAER